MFLSILFSILTATYTLNSTATVEQSGTAPESSVATYERTATSGQQGQMTEGNSTRLELSGWDGCTIRAVELQMRSNTKSGAGSLHVVVGIDTVWCIDNQSFSDEQWAGEYSTNWRSIAKSTNTLVEDAECIEIKILATENSLYIQSYTIYYEPPIPQCYTVTFYTGLDTCPITLKQSAPDEPLILPAWQDTAKWYFLGWTEEEVLDNQLITPLLSVGDTYLPRKNMTLWSVYSNQREHRAVSEYISGQYAIAMYKRVDSVGVVMDGYVENGVVSTQRVEMQRNNNGVYCIYSTLAEDAFYELQFYEDSTVSLMHNTTKGMIGYKDAKLSNADVLWRYRVLDDGSLAIYYFHDGEYYVLYMGHKQATMMAYAQRLDVMNWKSSALWLFPKLETEITTWPFGKYDDIPIILRPDGAEEQFFRFGIYEIHIKDGKKIIYVK